MSRAAHQLQHRGMRTSRAVAFGSLFVAQIRDSDFGYSRRQRTFTTNCFALRTKREVFGTFCCHKHNFLSDSWFGFGFSKPLCVPNKMGRLGAFCGRRHDFLKTICGSDWASATKPARPILTPIKRSRPFVQSCGSGCVLATKPRPARLILRPIERVAPLFKFSPITFVICAAGCLRVVWGFVTGWAIFTEQ